MEYKIISADDHVVEPPNIFEGRLPARLAARAPYVTRIGEEDQWAVDGNVLTKRAGSNRNNIKLPHELRGLVGPTNYDTVVPGVWQAEPRLKDYDADGVDAAVLYADFLPGFTGNPFWSLADDPELRLACIKAWNDWLIDEFCAVNPARLIPLCLVPAYDLEESVKEVKRCAEKGYTGALIGGVLDVFGFPTFYEHHWDPLWDALQGTDMIIALHQQSTMLDRRNAFRPNGWTDEDKKNLRGLPLAQVVWHVSTTQIALLDVLASGMLERFPRLKVLLGEGGVGWIPYTLSQLDFFWERNKSWIKPELTMPPSHYWRRQCYAAFWYERVDGYIIEQLGEDNVLWEDDYPHQLSDNGIRGGSAAYIEDSLKWVTDPKVRHKILAGNAVKLFHLEKYQNGNGTK